MRSGRVAVEIEAAGRFEDAVEFLKADGHHYEIGHHLICADESVKRLEHFGDLVAFENEFVIGLGDF